MPAVGFMSGNSGFFVLNNGYITLFPACTCVNVSCGVKNSQDFKPMRKEGM